jgi:hypothetical protein
MSILCGISMQATRDYRAFEVVETLDRNPLWDMCGITGGPVDNPFASVVLLAHHDGYCTEPQCLACGNVQFRGRLARIAGKDSQPLTEALKGLTPQKIMALPNWENCLRLAFMRLSPLQQEEALNTWADSLTDEVDFARAALVATSSTFVDWQITAKMWIQRSVELAHEANDQPLADTLIRLLGPAAAWYPKLVALSPAMDDAPRRGKRNGRGAGVRTGTSSQL